MEFTKQDKKYLKRFEYKKASTLSDTLVFRKYAGFLDDLDKSDLIYTVSTKASGYSIEFRNLEIQKLKVIDGKPNQTLQELMEYVRKNLQEFQYIFMVIN